MALYAMGDTHLSLGTDKPMDVFGGGWTGYVDKLREGFAQVAPEDTVVVFAPEEGFVFRLFARLAG